KLAELRATINEYVETLPEPVKVSINDLIVKGVALALVRVPQVNVSFDGERLLFKKHINVGVAVALEQGLIVPVIQTPTGVACWIWRASRGGWWMRRALENSSRRSSR